MVMQEGELRLQAENVQVRLFKTEMPEKLPTPLECIWCGPVEMINYEDDYKFEDEYSGTVFQYDGKIPGFECSSCEAEYWWGEVTLAVDKALLPLLSPSSPKQKALAEEVKQLSRIYEKRKSQ